MPVHLVQRQLLPLAVVLATGVPALLSGQAQTRVIATPTCDFTIYLGCSTSMSGAVTGAYAENTGSTMETYGTIFGTTTTLSTEETGRGTSWTTDQLTFSGGTPSQVFVDVLSEFDTQPALSQNAETTALMRTLVQVDYGGIGLFEEYSQLSGGSLAHVLSPNVSTVGVLTRYAFAYQGVSAFFQLTALGEGTLYSSSAAILSGSAFGRARTKLINVFGADADGNAIGGLTCSFASGAKCGYGINSIWPAPEPASLTLVATGLAGIFGAAWCKRRVATA